MMRTGANENSTRLESSPAPLSNKSSHTALNSASLIAGDSSRTVGFLCAGGHTVLPPPPLDAALAGWLPSFLDPGPYSLACLPPFTPPDVSLARRLCRPYSKRAGLRGTFPHQHPSQPRGRLPRKA